MKVLLVLLLASLAQPKVYIADKHRHPGSPQQVAALSKSCPAITIVGTANNVDFAVVWDSKTWEQTSWGGHQQEWFIYNSAGEVVASGVAHKMSNASKDICKAIAKTSK
jgi:hypothetical protein